MHYVSLALHKAVPPRGREAGGHDKVERGVGVGGGIVSLDVGLDARGLPHLVGFRKCGTDNATEKTWREERKREGEGERLKMVYICRKCMSLLGVPCKCAALVSVRRLGCFSAGT